jgi:hypothetical protein
MRDRITEKDLKNLCHILNEETGNPVDYFNKETGKCNPGNFHIDFAYGGTKLVQTCNESGGIREVTYGFQTKRKTYDAIQQFRADLHYEQNRKAGN